MTWALCKLEVADPWFKTLLLYSRKQPFLLVIVHIAFVIYIYFLIFNHFIYPTGDELGRDGRAVRPGDQGAADRHAGAERAAHQPLRYRRRSILHRYNHVGSIRRQFCFTEYTHTKSSVNKSYNSMHICLPHKTQHSLIWLKKQVRGRTVLASSRPT